MMKSKSVKLALAALALSVIMGAAFAAQAATLNLPLNPSGSELSPAMDKVRESDAYKSTRNNVRTETIKAQSAARPLEIEVAIEMASAMKKLIMPEQQAAMSDPTNPNSLGGSLAPPLL